MAVKPTLLSLMFAAVAVAQQPARPSATTPPNPAASPPGALAPQAATEATLKVGSEVKLDAVIAAQWLQGGAPKEFEKGKIYLFECWATWCSPCLAAIPHVNDLYKKYRDQGLRVYGMDVREDGKEQVEIFVKAKGEGMSYPVAYVGKEGAFENQWLKPAAPRGLPHTFVVKDGKIVLMTHPMLITEKLIKALLTGGDAAVQALSEVAAAQQAQDVIQGIMMAFENASRAGDSAIMEAKLAELEQADPKQSVPVRPMMKLDLLVSKRNWSGAAAALEAMPVGPLKQSSIMMTAQKIARDPKLEAPADFTKSIAKDISAIVEKAPAEQSNPFGFVLLASMQWKTGDKNAAVASAKQGVEAIARNPAPAGRKAPAMPFERFAKALEDGTLPSLQDLDAWMRDAMPPRPAPASPAPKAPTAENAEPNRGGLAIQGDPMACWPQASEI